MTFNFSIDYRTQWGEELRIDIDGRETAMHTTDGHTWHASIEMPFAELPAQLHYRYALYRNGALVWREWDVAPHRLRLDIQATNKTVNDDARTFTVVDLWRPIPENLPLYSSAITECVAPHHNASSDSTSPQSGTGGTVTGDELKSILPEYNRTVQLRIIEPHLRSDMRLAICGSEPFLGSWKTAVPLTLIGLQEWGISVDADKIFRPIHYKYVITDPEGHTIEWEQGDDRTIDSLRLAAGETLVQTDMPARFALPKWKCAGVVVPVFSLRSEQSCGIGDFGDLKHFILWAKSVGMHAVQILPINDTTMSGTWQDSYPYNAISIYALHPVYCDLNALPPLADKLQMEKYLIRRQALNALPAMDYEQAFKLKMDYLHQLYEQDGATVLASKGYKTFYAANSEWLVPYAAFSFLRDTYHTADFSHWPKYAVYARADIQRLCSPRGKHHHEVAFYCFVQYILHQQLTDTHDTARASGVILKGDIPIGISRTSVEAWAEPQYFNLTSQAGAPPDDFSENGQNWGFPTYDWDTLMRDGCTWWKARFKKMAAYFDAYRIDHVLGFFRIWDIPTHAVHGLLGQFSPALPMGQSEIESYGFHFDPEHMTRPYINDDVLYAIFGYRAQLVKTLYLNVKAQPDDIFTPFNAFGGINGTYTMKADYDTQRKVEAAFADKDTPEDQSLRDGLYTLISNVLFVPDRKNAQMYHPRICAQKSLAYRALSDQQRHAFDRLYEDYFYHRHNQYWYREAMRKLPMLTQATRMLVCAEDLGMVPECVAWVMQELRILSLEIQTMPKAFGVEFGTLSDNPYRSVATIFTHDMPTLRGWWDEDHDRAQRYYNHALHIDGDAPRVMPGWLCEEVVKRHLYCPSMLCMISLQDWLSIDETLRNADIAAERINIPARPRHYWRWRMHLTIEQLEQSTAFNNHLRTLIERAGR